MLRGDAENWAGGTPPRALQTRRAPGVEGRVPRALVAGPWPGGHHAAGRTGPACRSPVGRVLRAPVAGARPGARRLSDMCGPSACPCCSCLTTRRLRGLSVSSAGGPQASHGEIKTRSIGCGPWCGRAMQVGLLPPWGLPVPFSGLSWPTCAVGGVGLVHLPQDRADLRRARPAGGVGVLRHLPSATDTGPGGPGCLQEKRK